MATTKKTGSVVTTEKAAETKKVKAITAKDSAKTIAAKAAPKEISGELKAKAAAAPAKAKAAPAKTAAPKAQTKPKAKAEPKAKQPKAAKAQPAEVGAPRKKKVLFVASEVRPFAASGGLGEVMGSLPESINSNNPDYDVRVVMPLYESVSDEFREAMKFMGYIYVPVAWRSQYCGIFELKRKNTIYYFLDNEYYFKRPNLYGYYDDGERFAFFSRAAIEFLSAVGFKPDVMACNDWQTALTPIFYKLFYMYNPALSGIRQTFTIHNIEYQGKFPKAAVEDLFGIPYFELPSIEHNNSINLMTGAIDYAETVNTVAPTYAQDILHPFDSHGLDDVLTKNAWKLRGILNGIDTEGYDPATDKAIFHNFDRSNMRAEKAANKLALQKMFNLREDKDVPMVAIISRLVQHKGMDLVKYVADDLLKNDVQLVVLGKGDTDYENYFNYLQSNYDKKVCSIIAFNLDLSRKIYAAADIFLMPSKSEPCGLSQMIASRYGTVPVVRETGGLYDSIKDCGDGKSGGNGFTFAAYNAKDLLQSLNRAVCMYRDYRDIFFGIAERAMDTDFSWKVSAKEYVKMFDEIIY